jgi:hypothetical protein
MAAILAGRQVSQVLWQIDTDDHGTMPGEHSRHTGVSRVPALQIGEHEHQRVGRTV